MIYIQNVPKIQITKGKYNSSFFQDIKEAVLKFNITINIILKIRYFKVTLTNIKYSRKNHFIEYFEIFAVIL